MLVSRLTADAGEWLESALRSMATTSGENTSLRLKVTFGDVARNLKHQLSDTTEGRRNSSCPTRRPLAFPARSWPCWVRRCCWTGLSNAAASC